MRADVCDILAWGGLDVQKLEARFQEAAAWGVSDEELEDWAEEVGGVADINSWFSAALGLTASRIFLALREYAAETGKDPAVVDRAESNYSPVINGLDSWHNNFLDEADLSRGPAAIPELWELLEEYHG